MLLWLSAAPRWLLALLWLWWASTSLCATFTRFCWICCPSATRTRATRSGMSGQGFCYHLPVISFCFFSFFWLKKGFCWRGTKLVGWWEEKGKEGRRDKLIITAFQLGMWRCCCLSPHTFPSFMPPSIFCPPSSLIVPNSPPLSLLLLSVGVQQPYKSGLAP